MERETSEGGLQKEAEGNDNIDGIVNSVEAIAIHQARILEQLNIISKSLDEYSTHDGLTIEQVRQETSGYRSKLQNLRISMLKVNERCGKLHSRLNAIRKDCAPQQAHVEIGPFHYRCVYKGGVRYRDYPSSNARVTGKILNYDDVVTVAERVFITGESSIFLHVRGVGWLFENRDSLICCERCVPPPPTNDDEDDVDGADDDEVDDLDLTKNYDFVSS